MFPKRVARSELCSYASTLNASFVLSFPFLSISVYPTLGETLLDAKDTKAQD